jgi:IS30 family transposase
MGQDQHTTKARRWKHLSEGERYKIEALLQAGLTPLEVSRRIGRDRRTIEREIVRGSVIQVDSLWRERLKYCADTGQRKHNEQAANKGRPLKIGHDHRLAEYIEKKIGTEKYSPDAVIGEIKTKGMSFETRLCTKTIYNYIDKCVFQQSRPAGKEGWKEATVPENGRRSAQQSERAKYRRTFDEYRKSRGTMSLGDGLCGRKGNGLPAGHDGEDEPKGTDI